MAALHGSTRGHGLRVEEHDHRAGFDEIVQRDRLAVLIEQLEVVDDVTFVHGYSQTASEGTSTSEGPIPITAATSAMDSTQSAKTRLR